MNRVALCIFLGILALPARAEEPDPLPDFQSCINTEVARYERALRRLQDGSGEAISDIAGTGRMDVCGVTGIMRCDRGDDPLPCQHDLAVRQDGLRQEVLAALPEPEAVAGKDGEWSDGLYPVVWELAHGSSAGPDCSGDTPVMEAWCTAREATRRLNTAVLLYQLARYLDAAEPAVAVGWAQEPPPTRPRARTAEDEGDQ